MTHARIVRTGMLAVAALLGSIAPAGAEPPGSAGPPPVFLAPVLELAQFAQRPHPGSEPRIRGGRPGQFDYYALVLSWSPTFCASTDRPEEAQCNRRDGRRFSFVLHGLWPQYQRGFPQDCPSDERPFVPQSTIDRMLDIMPSRNLVIHEYRKHGVCSGLGVEGYFDLARQLFAKVRIPQRFVEPEKNQMVDTSAVVDEFVAANPGLRPEMLGVACGGPGDRLREVRICFTQQGAFRACGDNENARRLCRAPRVFVPPVRPSMADEPPRRGNRPGQGPFLPGPQTPAGPRAL